MTVAAAVVCCFSIVDRTVVLSNIHRAVRNLNQVVGEVVLFELRSFLGLFREVVLCQTVFCDEEAFIDCARTRAKHVSFHSPVGR